MVQNNNETSMTRALGRFAQALDYEDLSPEVIDWAKYLCLDFAAVTLNGSTTGSARAVVDALGLEWVNQRADEIMTDHGPVSAPVYTATCTLENWHSPNKERA